MTGGGDDTGTKLVMFCAQLQNIAKTPMLPNNVKELLQNKAQKLGQNAMRQTKVDQTSMFLAFNSRRR
jgi:hypothetical protein